MLLVFNFIIPYVSTPRLTSHEANAAQQSGAAIAPTRFRKIDSNRCKQIKMAQHMQKTPD